jgi:putative endonuclease
LSLFSFFDSIRDAVRRRRWTPERAAAVRGEDLAMRYLEKRKYVIVARNYRPRAGYGEVDLIGWENGRLAFIEVKTRSSDETGAPEQAVHRKKRQYLERTAREYAHRADVEFDLVRFDVVTVLELNPVRIELFQNAFSPGRY